MRIKNKLFPYPTVQMDNGVYKNAIFETAVRYQVEHNKFKLFCSAHINVPEIQALIDAKKAAYVFHFECARTYYREKVAFRSEEHCETIDGEALDRKLEICPMIVATEDIDSFSCDDLSDMFSGEEISFAKGDIIAIGRQQELTIVKEQDNLKKLSSIFYVDSYPEDVEYKHISIQPDDRQIGILIPKNDAARFRQCKDDPRRKHTLFSAFFFPALIAVVDLMKSQDGEQYSDSLWYVLLSLKGKEKGIGDVEQWQDRTSFEIAQILFDYPVTSYLKELATISEGEDSI
ncbi:MAG: hypothetical protein II897_01545 [Clostridia bacterium]|nr:hypothetical protein [Clostridia bacterium]